MEKIDVSNVKIGETIDINGKQYICKAKNEHDSCKGCALCDESCENLFGCSSLGRSDGQGVIFVEADKAEAEANKAQPDPSLEKVKTYNPAMMIEFKIGEVFEYKGKKYKCEYGEMRRCKDCAFRHDDDACRSAVCSRYLRKDSNSAIFVEIPSFDPATIPDGMKLIPAELYDRLDYLGLIPNGIRSHNVGTSDYAKHTIQPWSVWLDYPGLTSWDHDIIKRVLRTKADNPRQLDYKKIIHECQERLRQLEFCED